LAVVTLPYARLPLTAGQRRILTAGIALFLAALAAWVTFVLPAYWD